MKRVFRPGDIVYLTERVHFSPNLKRVMSWRVGAIGKVVMTNEVGEPFDWDTNRVIFVVGLTKDSPNLCMLWYRDDYYAVPRDILNKQCPNDVTPSRF